MKKILSLSTVLLLIVSANAFNCLAQDYNWQPAEPRLETPWTGGVSPDRALPEYPRPQMKREAWKNLNGLWEYAILPIMEHPADKWHGEILVPYPVESALSGVKKRVGPDHRLWYRRNFTVPDAWKGQQVLLHFGAVDWKTEIYVNGRKVGGHRGGYDPFTLNITGALETSGDQQLTVSVWDPSDAGYQPHGKQVRDPRGIWYTPSTGIWQTVWLEPVPRTSIKDLAMTPDIDQQRLKLEVKTRGPADGISVRAVALDGDYTVGEIRGRSGEQLELELDEMKLWSPDKPFLYDLEVSLLKDGQVVDRVESYFGMREVRLGKDEEGYVKLFLNDEPLFQFGLLDQGFWPDGIYTAPTDEALKHDIEVTKKLGYNMIRKHVKVEPARWYYWADKLGVLVWQDMPSGDKHIRRGEDDIERVAQSAEQFKMELGELIDDFYNHPSIITWVPFNEGWGQFQTAQVSNMVKTLDPSRLVNVVSGWNDRGVSDIHDIHSYPGPDMPPTEEDRASVLGEFGGQALVVENHLWLNDFSKAPGHYKTSTSKENLHAKYDSLIHELATLRNSGLAAAVYTQTTDVEFEVNGIMTYDREVIKFDQEHMRRMHEALIDGTLE